MALNINSRYRIKRSGEYEKQMQYLIQDLKVFQSYAQVLVISAIVGYNHKKFVPISKPASDGVLMQFFTDYDKDLINLIAYAHTKQQRILREEDSSTEMYNIFESYANGGFPLLVGEGMLDIDFDNVEKNDRLAILRKYYTLLVTNGFLKMDD